MIKHSAPKNSGPGFGTDVHSIPIDNYESIIRALIRNKNLDDEDLLCLLETDRYDLQLQHAADAVRRRFYGTDVYVRGLIEFSNHCKNNCFYCGIRAGNSNIRRYWLTKREIIACCREGYDLAYRTFVLQSGDDPQYSDSDICEIIYRIKSAHPDCAVTLSIGEKSKHSYAYFRAAGADRYLLRHETADEEHYRLLHPRSMSLKNRKRCLFDLKELGFQVGSGFMVGSPYQTTRHLIADIRFLQELKPDMIGIGPYLTHRETPFASFPDGDLNLTLKLISILRLTFPYALIPATTALGTIHPLGREMGLKAGANVVMPNLSPVSVRKQYELYENKICTGKESAQCRGCLARRVDAAGYHIINDIGNVIPHDR